jgi:zinc transport system substrate-binding protein
MMVLMLRVRADLARPTRGIAASVASVVAGVIGLALLVGGAGGTAGAATSGAPLRVEAGFYPLAWMAERVGGPLVGVKVVTPPGAEPHDFELSPRRVARIADADAVVFLRGFQPAVDAAVRNAPKRRRFDAGSATKLDLRFTPIEDGKVHRDEAGSVDPHFWLDPTKLAEVADGFATFLGGLDPANTAVYAANAATLRQELTLLDGEMRAGLAGCENDDLVTSHNAFGYLARRYGMTQVGITNLTPEEEPSPKDLAKVTDFVQRHRVGTIYFETLVPKDIAKTVARETGARTDVLDPIEGLTDQSQGDDYLAIMRANLRNIRRGQPCP